MHLCKAHFAATVVHPTPTRLVVYGVNTACVYVLKVQKRIKIRKHRPCVQKDGTYRFRESGKWQPNALSGQKAIFVRRSRSLAKGEVGAVLQVLEGTES